MRIPLPVLSVIAAAWATACGGPAETSRAEADALLAEARETGALDDVDLDALELAPGGPDLPPELFEGLDLLRVALRQQQSYELWDQVEPVAGDAAAALARARAAGAPESLCDAGAETAAALQDWHGLYLEALQARPGDAAAELRAAAMEVRLEALLERLAEVEGLLPQTSALLADVQMLSGDADGGALTLRYALEKWPGDDDLHELTRAWRDAIPDPQATIDALDRALRLHAGELGVRARVLATRGYLRLSQAGGDYGAGELERAAEGYDGAARDFTDAYAAQAGGATLSSDDADLLAAEGHVSAGWAHFHLAKEAAEAGDPPTATARLSEAERAFSAALSRVAGNERAIEGLDYVGDAFVNPAVLDDMAAGREFFGRAARRFDLARWWNNFAFFCRETAPDDDPAVTARNYRRSYEAYERCIELEPDNARYVNDTALIIVHYLYEDADEPLRQRAEALLKRAWQLGRAACDNPFVDDETFASNFEAYGDAMYNLGLLYFREGRLDEAREVVAELIEAAPLRPDARLLIRQIQDAET